MPICHIYQWIEFVKHCKLIVSGMNTEIKKCFSMWRESHWGYLSQKHTVWREGGGSLFLINRSPRHIWYSSNWNGMDSCSKWLQRNNHRKTMEGHPVGWGKSWGRRECLTQYIPTPSVIHPSDVSGFRKSILQCDEYRHRVRINT